MKSWVNILVAKSCIAVSNADFLGANCIGAAPVASAGTAAFASKKYRRELRCLQITSFSFSAWLFSGSD